MHAHSRVVVPYPGGAADVRLREAAFGRSPIDGLEPVQRAFAVAVRDGGLLVHGDRILVAASGGADSTALLLLVAALRPDVSVVVAHLDHGLRPESADDARYVSSVAAQLHIDFIHERVEIAPEPAGSVETRAREARYAFLARAAAAAGATKVATGHHRDDQVETVLFRLLRGSGVRGLRGIPTDRRLAPGSAARVIRPLLEVGHGEIVSHLRSLGVTWREDSTNGSVLTGVRNRIRNSWLPDLESHAPDVRERLVKLAAAAQAVERGISSAADTVRREAELRPGVFRTDLLRRVDTPILHEVLAPFRPAASEVARLAARLDEEPVRASILELRTGPAIAIGRDFVTISTAPPSFPGRLRMEPFPLDRWDDFLRDKGPLEEVVDADRVDVTGLSSRSRRPGDRLHPLGAPGTRKVKNILADDGVPRRERLRWPIVVDAAQSIVWIVGVRLAHEARVRPGETARAVRLVWEA